MLADLVNNASGLGFNGYDANGNARWDLVTNINIMNLEVSLFFYSFLNFFKMISLLLKSSCQQVLKLFSIVGTFKHNFG